MNRSEKADFVKSLQSDLSSCQLAVIVAQSGIGVAESTQIRVSSRSQEVSCKMLKNSLAKIAVKNSSFEPLSEKFVGQCVLMSSADPLAAARVAHEYAGKFKEKFSIVCGCLNGELLPADGVKYLATLPSLDELRAKIIAIVQTPASRIARVLQAHSEQ